ncbi:MAG: roadblock/LC7 domain-containing protein [Candidatus Eremiobacteraeota bacterium]|nr:roadblock/LC7 domain-containing protein [Candidatus Eremiobacteraeota bacterium]
MAELNKILENLCTVEGVQGAFLIDEEGNMVESVMDQPIDIDGITNLAYRCVTSGRMIANSIGKKALKQSYVEFKNSSLTLDLLKNDAILALLATSGSNLGRIRLEIRKNKKSVENLLS